MADLELRFSTLKERPFRFFHESAFDNRNRRRKIVAPMPNFEEFQIKRGKLKAKAPVNNEFYYAYLEPLLTAKQEYHLFRQFNYLKYRFSKLLSKPASLFVIEGAENFWRKAVNVKRQIASSNTRLVINIAKRFHTINYRSLLQDLVAEGNVGLMHSIDCFDFRKGFRFSTYATYAIRTHIMNYINRKYLPTGAEDLIEKNLIYDTDCSEEDREYRCYIANELIQKVPQRERDVVINYFGLYDTPQGQTLEDISSRLQISKERVRQLRNQGLDRMRKHLGIHTKEAK